MKITLSLAILMSLAGAASFGNTLTGKTERHYTLNSYPIQSGQTETLKPVKKCRTDSSDKASQGETDGCTSRIPEAPDVYETTISTRVSAEYEDATVCGPPPLLCRIVRSFTKAIAIDFDSLTTRLLTKLNQAGQNAKFSGFRSGEILITSSQRQMQFAGTTALAHYQIRFLTYPCSGTWKEENICTFSGGASLISKNPHGGWRESQDELCSSLEKIATDYIAEANSPKPNRP